MENKLNLKPIFSRHPDIDKMSFLNWRMESSDMRNVLNLAEGYIISAIQLSEKCLLDNEDKKADILIFPILANANHAIELYLKGLTIILNEILDNNQKIEGTHNLKQLFNTLKARIKELDGQRAMSEFEDYFIELSEYIDELVQKIDSTPQNDKMDFARYPFTKKFENHFYVDGFKNIEIDMENLKNRLESLSEKFESYSDFLFYERMKEKK